MGHRESDTPEQLSFSHSGTLSVEKPYTKHLLSHKVSKTQEESRSDLDEWLWMRASPSAVVKLWAGAAALKT